MPNPKDATWALAFAWGLVAGGVRAEDTAERLFREGLDDMLAGKYESGCPALAESFRLDPLPGALFTLAECESKRGRMATALVHYRDYLSRVERMDDARRAKQAERVVVAESQVDALGRQVPAIVLRLVEAPPAGTVVRRDGDVVPMGQLGLPIQVDPGKHTLEVSVEGRPEPWVTTVDVVPRDRQEVRLELPPAAGDEPSGEGESWVPYVGWGLVGLGGAGIVVGAITGGITVGHASTVNDACDEGICRSQEGLDAADAAATTGAVSTAGFVVGGVALAAGVAVLLFLPDSDVPEGDGADEAAAGWRLAPGPGELSLGAVYTW